MNDLEILKRYADKLGITTEWRDAWDRPAGASARTIEALAVAQGYDLSTPEGMAESTIRLQHAEDVEGAPPVATFIKGEALELPVCLKAHRLGTLAWRVETEAGQILDGTIELGHMPVASVSEHGAVNPVVTRRLACPVELPLGYHRLFIDIEGIEAETLIVVAPAQCYLPEAIEAGGRGWGLAVQLYALRSAENWGIGDFGDLKRLAEGLGPKGVATIGLNPLNALFPNQPTRLSPYAPSSRRYLNPLYIDVASCPDFLQAPGAQAMVADPRLQDGVAAARKAEFVDYTHVAAAKHAAFQLMWRHFRDIYLSDPANPRGQAFRRFQADGGKDLEDFARFETLQAELDGAWMSWPEALRHPASPAVDAFAASHRDAVDAVQYLQWIADSQLGEAALAARRAGVLLGFYRDLAVGFDGGGADGWTGQHLLVAGAAIGAPPDVLNRKGQDWGLAAVSPGAMRRDRYQQFTKALRANMRHAGALRIDHVMILRQLYLVPAGMDPTEGAYVRYPFEDLLRIVALESVRNECLIIGEDLGTVPPGFREALSEARVLSYKVLPFERWDNGMFKAPDAYPRLSVASVGTHDIATIKGSWLGRDLDWRRQLDLYPDETARENEARSRLQERVDLLNAFSHYSTLDDADRTKLLPETDEPVFDFALTEAAYRYLAETPSMLMLVQAEDVLEEVEAPNLPGTIDEHPNWRRRLSATISEFLTDPRLDILATRLNLQRKLP